MHYHISLSNSYRSSFERFRNGLEGDRFSLVALGERLLVIAADVDAEQAFLDFPSHGAQHFELSIRIVFIKIDILFTLGEVAD